MQSETKRGTLPSCSVKNWLLLPWRETTKIKDSEGRINKECSLGFKWSLALGCIIAQIVQEDVSFPSCILKGKVGQLSTIFVSWHCNLCKETALICSCQHLVSVSICLFAFSFSASTVVPTDLLFNSFMFGCLSRQLGKEVVSNWCNICYLVLSYSIAVNKCLKSITKCTVSFLHLLR